MSDFRKPRPDIPILPQSALFRRTPLTPFKAPKGRKGRKPRGQKLKPKTLSQFNKFHSEAARNKERDRAEQERIDAIKERDEARRERRERLQIEDRRYAAKAIVDARERAAERGFRAEQLRLLRQQAAAAAAPPPPPPAINIAPPAVNIAPPDIQVRPVINLPQPGQLGAAQGGGDYRDAREEARRFAAFRQEVQADIRRGFAEGARALGLGQEAQRRQPEVVVIPDPRAGERERELAQARAEAQRRIDPNDPEYQAQLREDREAAIERGRGLGRAEAELEGQQAQRDLLQQTQARIQQEREAGEVRIRAAQAQAARQLEEAAGARGQGEQELTQQLSRAQRARNQAEDRARELQGRAEELERHNQSLQQQRNQDPVNRAAIRREVIDGVREEIEIDIGDRLEEQYRDLVLRQASQAQRNDPEFQRRLTQEAFRVNDRLEIPFGGDEVSEEDRPFVINPFRPENEEFLRRQLAVARMGQNVEGRRQFELGERFGRQRAGGEIGEGERVYSQTPETFQYTEEQIQDELERIRQEERERMRQRLGRGGVGAVGYGEVAGFERDFSSEEEEQQPPQVSRRNTTLDPAQIDPLTQSQLDRDFDEIEARRPVDFNLEFDVEAAERQARGLPRAGGSGGSQRRETPREQADRQALERQASQERVSRLQERRAERIAGGIPLPSDVEPEPELVDVSLEAAQPEPEPAESPDSSLESLESEQDNWEIVRSNFEAGNSSTFHRGKQGRDSLRPDSTHFTFRDDEGFLGKGKTATRFKGQDLVILDVNPTKGNVLVRTKDSVNKRMTQKERAEVEGNIKFGFLNNLVELGSINLQEIDHTLQPVEQTALRGTPADIAAAVGGAVATGAGVVGNAALGAARGVAGGVYERLPTAGQVGEAAGRGAVAAVSGLAGAARGAFQAATSPREPAVGEQTGGGLLPAGVGTAGLGRVEDTDEL